MENPYSRIIRGSSIYFGGFESIIDIRYYNTLDEIINSWKSELLKVLTQYNLEALIHQLNQSIFHIHTHTFPEILLDPEACVYLCSCEQK